MFPRPNKSQPVSARAQFLRPGPYRPQPAPTNPGGRTAIAHQQYERDLLEAQLAIATHGAQALAAREKARNEARYHLALHLHDPRLGRQDATAATRPDLNNRPRYEAHLRMPAMRQAQYAQQLARELTVVRRAPTPLEKLSAHVRATNSPEIAYMMESDPFVRGVAVSVASVAVAYGAVELGGAMLVEEAVAWQSWRSLGWATGRGMAMRFTANSVGQGVGNYIVSGNTVESVNNINWGA